MENELKFDDDKATTLVIEWQTNPQEEIAEEVLSIYHNYFKSMMRKYIWVEDISGIIYENFMKCMKNFDADKIYNRSFNAYLLQNLEFTIMKQIDYMKDPKFGVSKVEVGLTPKGKKSYRVDRTNNWLSIIEKINGKSSVKDSLRDNKNDYDNVIMKMIWEEAQTKIDKPKYLAVIKLQLAGYSQTEMVKMLNISQARISTMVKEIQMRNPIFCDWLREALEVIN